MKHLILSLFGIFAFCSMFFNILKPLSGVSVSDTPFTSFIEYVSNAPQISVIPSVLDSFITGNWGVFDGLRVFFNFIINAFNFILFLGQCAINAVIYLFYFLQYLFFDTSITAGSVAPTVDVGWLGGR